MHRNSLGFAFALLAGCAAPSSAQVLSPPEVLDPDMRVLQEKHFPELKAAAVDITSHQFPYRFYLSRTLDVTEQQEQQIDRRSIRFANFQGQTVVQVTGNYFAAYSDRSMDRSERVKRTYTDVVLPILRALAPRLAGEPKLTSYAIEISHHVRKQVLGVAVETPENLALILPRAMAEKAAASNDVVDQITALRASSVYVDGSPTMLWSDQNAGTPVKKELDKQPATPAISSALLSKEPAISPPVRPQPIEPATPLMPAPARDVSPEALQRKQSAYQDLLDRIVRELDSQAHFVSYAPPVLIGFRKASYLQLSITTTLLPSDAGSQYRIAALAFDRHISHLIRTVLAFFKQDAEFDGIVFSSTVKIPGKTLDSSITQSVEFFFPFAELRRYEQYDITGQQLINSGFVLINGERVGLELQTAESDIR
jgi:hypothetical protein